MEEDIKSINPLLLSDMGKMGSSSTAANFSFFIVDTKGRLVAPLHSHSDLYMSMHRSPEKTEPEYPLVSQHERVGNLVEHLCAANRLLRAFIDSSDTAMRLCDCRLGKVLAVNRAYCTQTELAKEEIVGKRCREIAATCDGFFCPRQATEKEGETPDTSVWEYYNSKQNMWLRCTGKTISLDGENTGYMVSQLDISEEYKMKKELARLAFFDAQTSLPNGQKLLQDMQGIYSDPHGGKKTALLCFDFTSIRYFNGAYGQDPGSRLLKSILDWFDEDFSNDMLYRINEYEFCLPLRVVSDEEARITAQYIYDRFSNPWMVEIEGEEMSYFCGISLSLICSPEKVSDRDTLGLIDRTLDIARKSNRIFIYDEEMDQKSQERLRLAMSMKECLKRDMLGFEVHFQPIVEISSGIWKGLEALCRWTSPELGRVSPVVFIREAEQAGLICLLGSWVLETAVRRCKELKLDEIEGFFLSVNVSPIQMMDDTFADTVISVLEHYRYRGDMLNLEITESTELTFNSFTMAVIEKLRARGVRIALDDFGSGYSSFNNLKNLPVSFLKTERDFIQNIEQDSYLQYFFYILSEIAHANSMKLIAEGIEERTQLEIIKNNGGDYIQGFFFSKPLPAHELVKYVGNFNRTDEILLSTAPQPVNINQWLSGKDAYVITPNLLKVLNQCMQILLSETRLDIAFYKVLRVVGEHFDAERAFAFLRDPQGGYTNIQEWCAPGVGSLKPLLAQYDIRNITQSVFEALTRDKMLVSSDTSKLPESLREMLDFQGIRAIVILPMFDEGELAGFVGCDDHRYREWSPDAVIMLWNLCAVMINHIKRENMKIQIDEKTQILTDVLDSTRLNVFIGDADTYEILWANSVLKSQHCDGEPIEGKKCYEIIEGRSQPCPTCRIKMLQEHPELGQVSYEHYNEHLKRSFITYSSRIQWQDNKRAYIEYSLDTTEHKEAQKQLEYFATIDALTGTANRSRLMAQLRNLLQKAHREGKRLSVAFVDVDGLKYVNDTYGHSAGDRLLCDIADSIRTYTRDGDVVGRIGGDEFAVLFPGCGKLTADKRMTQARNYLLRSKKLPENFRKSFSFGTVENTERPFSDDEAYVNELLNIADNRRREYKTLMSPTE